MKDDPAFPIPVSPNAVAIIDSDDAERVNQYSWSLVSKGRPRARVNGKKTYLHRLILNAPEGAWVDHVNGDPLDNRRINLRFCNANTNAKNRGRNKKSKAGFKGVRWHAATQKWGVSIRSDNKEYWLGVFVDRVAAAITYDRAALRLHGEFARTNFPIALLAELEKK